MGKEVSYDRSTNTVYLGKSGQVQYLGQQVKKYQGDASEETVTMGGNKYTNGLVFNYFDANAYYNLNGLYSSISGVYGTKDGTGDDYECALNFYGDGRLLKSITVKGGQLPKNFAVDVSGVAQLKIEIENFDSICLGSVEFK